MTLEYFCPHCMEGLLGSFGDNVYCNKCDKTFETQWDYGAIYYPVGWLAGKEWEGRFELPDQTTQKSINYVAIQTI